MFVSHRREKLLNAIVFFLQNTAHCNTLKLIKLLYFLDFEHYRQTGRGVTGLKYSALKQGPVPWALLNEMKKPMDDFRATVAVDVQKDELTDDVKRRDFRPLRKFDRQYFSRREMDIINWLAETFRDATATQMSKFSHAPKMPWEKIWGPKGEGSNKEIPYDLAISSPAIIKQMPTIDNERLEYVRDAYREVNDAKGGGAV